MQDRHTRKIIEDYVYPVLVFSARLVVGEEVGARPPTRDLFIWSKVMLLIEKQHSFAMITYSCTVCKLMLKGVKTFLVYMGLKWSVKVKTTATNNTQYSSSCKDDRCHSDSNTHTTPQNNNVRHVHNTCTYHRIHYIFNCHTCRLQCIVIYHIVQWKTKNS